MRDLNLDLLIYHQRLVFDFRSHLSLLALICGNDQTTVNLYKAFKGILGENSASRLSFDASGAAQYIFRKLKQHKTNLNLSDYQKIKQAALRTQEQVVLYTQNRLEQMLPPLIVTSKSRFINELKYVFDNTLRFEIYKQYHAINLQDVRQDYWQQHGIYPEFAELVLWIKKQQVSAVYDALAAQEKQMSESLKKRAYLAIAAFEQEMDEICNEERLIDAVLRLKIQYDQCLNKAPSPEIYLYNGTVLSYQFIATIIGEP